MSKMTPYERHQLWLLTGKEEPADDDGLWWWFLGPAFLIVLALVLDGVGLRF